MPEWFESTFCYVFDPSDSEYFQKGDQKFLIENSAEISKSMYVDSTFKEFDSALKEYKHSFAKSSTCDILKGIWHDKERMILRNKPEHIMRKSLTQFLKTKLRSCDVEPEQNVDETHPVDIKIAWSNSKALSLIEIKWLGDSVQEDTTKDYTTYREARANEGGAEQLANYLEMNKETDTVVKCQKGKLIVYDARRRSLGKCLPIPTECYGRDKAYYYKDKEIEYDPKYADIRDDFDKPERIYLEPRIL